jgi:hypothetical protein
MAAGEEADAATGTPGQADLSGLTPIGRELLLEIASQLAILMARRDHAAATGEQTGERGGFFAPRVS